MDLCFLGIWDPGHAVDLRSLVQDAGSSAVSVECAVVSLGAWYQPHLKAAAVILPWSLTFIF